MVVVFFWTQNNSPQKRYVTTTGVCLHKSFFSLFAPAAFSKYRFRRQWLSNHRRLELCPFLQPAAPGKSKKRPSSVSVNPVWFSNTQKICFFILGACGCNFYFILPRRCKGNFTKIRGFTCFIKIYFLQPLAPIFSINYYFITLGKLLF